MSILKFKIFVFLFLLNFIIYSYIFFLALRIEDEQPSYNITLGTTNNTILKGAIQNKFGDIDIVILDKAYNLTNTSNFNKYLIDNYESYTYIIEYYDCDDIALRFVGRSCQEYWSSLPIGVGIIENGDTTSHMTVLFMDNDYTFWKVENYQLEKIDNEKFIFIMM